MTDSMMMEAEGNNNGTNISSNFSLDDESRVTLGIAPQGALLLLYLTTTLTSVIGNTLVIMVFSLAKRSRTDLTGFLINLAAADLIMSLFCMPFTFTNTILGTWVFGMPVCVLVLFMQTLSVTASVGTSTAIAVDRYLAVIQPFSARTYKIRTRYAVIAIWIISGCLASVQLAVGRTIPVGEPDENPTIYCMEIWPEPSHTWRISYTFFILITTYTLPLLAITVAYGYICRHLWKHRTPGNADEARDNMQLKSKRKIIKMLIVVVILFGLCWLPLHLFTLISDLTPVHEIARTNADLERALMALYLSTHWLAMSNSCVNPIIYGFLNDSFRHELRRMFCKCSRACSRACPSCKQLSVSVSNFDSFVTEANCCSSDDEESDRPGRPRDSYASSTVSSRSVYLCGWTNRGRKVSLRKHRSSRKRPPNSTSSDRMQRSMRGSGRGNPVTRCEPGRKSCTHNVRVGGVTDRLANIRRSATVQGSPVIFHHHPIRRDRPSSGPSAINSPESCTGAVTRYQSGHYITARESSRYNRNMFHNEQALSRSIPEVGAKTEGKLLERCQDKGCEISKPVTQSSERKGVISIHEFPIANEKLWHEMCNKSLRNKCRTLEFRSSKINLSSSDRIGQLSSGMTQKTI